ncbi:hypothetical protein DesLBE_4704 [Desulfitobacterium sp. LBE]|uniref:hypothetical protein n=1 Tax=Desulfitobacterium sp. LBE TaxID=884086 RepID=UPI00119C691A|nr:hypothetical protein [Desulfitobacterium sp. LBE]TWH60272.1 hypothetical protein DesLBE_4704 [Desulfitobacterium sp. LBE]
MDTAKAKRALKKLAKQKGISKKEIYREMEIAIAEAMTNPEPQAQAFWKSIPHRRGQPTPEDIIAYIADRVKE